MHQDIMRVFNICVLIYKSSEPMHIVYLTDNQVHMVILWPGSVDITPKIYLRPICTSHTTMGILPDT